MLFAWPQSACPVSGLLLMFLHLFLFLTTFLLMPMLPCSSCASLPCPALTSCPAVIHRIACRFVSSQPCLLPTPLCLSCRAMVAQKRPRHSPQPVQHGPLRRQQGTQQTQRAPSMPPSATYPRCRACSPARQGGRAPAQGGRQAHALPTQLGLAPSVKEGAAAAA